MTRILELLGEALAFDFIRRALIVGTLLAVCCSLLGLFLVLRKQSMIGDGLAHVSFGAIALAQMLRFFVGMPLVFTIPVVVLASLAILKLNERADLHGDAAIGLVSAISVAAGILFSSLAKGYAIDPMSLLFGSILLIGRTELISSIVLTVVVSGLIVFFLGDFFMIAYDSEYARAIGLKTQRLNQLLAILTALTISIGIGVFGTLLISSLIIFPTVSAMQRTHSFRGTIVLSVAISVTCVILGIFASYLLDWPTGATIVLLNGVVFMLLFSSRLVIGRR